MNKILIIGISGTGKTRLARKLSKHLNIPIIHYDELVWGENWNEVDENIVRQKIHKETLKDKWIIEGYIHPASKSRLKNADRVIYLDYSSVQAFWGGLQRWWQHRGSTRPEMAPGCIETFDKEFLKIMWHRLERPDIEKAIKEFEHKVIRLKSRRALNKYLAKFLKK